MRVWLQKQKKKEEAKAAAQAATPVLETTPAATEAPSESESADKPVDSVEEVPATGDAPANPAVATTDGDGDARTVSASVQPVEVGLQSSSLATHDCMCDLYKSQKRKAAVSEGLNLINTIDLARAGGCSMHILPCALADLGQGSTAPDNDDPERRGSLVSQTATQSVEPSAANASSDEQNNTNGSTSMMGNNPIMNGMHGQMGFGFQGQGNFGGMGFNGMSNMMGNANWSNMNPMGTSHSTRCRKFHN
jgi:hypothetical protein